MIQKMDKFLVKAYKSMLIEKLKDVSTWYESYGEFTSRDSSNISFVLKKNKSVDVRINSNGVYTFNTLKNPDLLFRVLYFQKMKKHEKINIETKGREKKMREALPDEYRRSLKISKIRSKI